MLDQIQVRYAIIGGVAVSIRSVPRFTRDVDAVIWAGESGWDTLLDQMNSHGLEARAKDPIGFARLNQWRTPRCTNKFSLSIASS